MSPERDEPPHDQEQEVYEDVPPRSIFAATWFRVVLVVIVLGVIGAVAVPYVLDWMNPPPAPRTASTTPPAAPAPPSPFDKPADGPAAADKPTGDRKDSTLIPVPAAPPATTPAPTAAAPPRPELKSEPKPAPTAARPEPKPSPRTTAAKPADTTSRTAAAVTETKPSAPPKSSPKAAETTKPDAPKPATARTAAATTAGGPFWVQVGAFRDPEAAKRLAARLREENFKVDESARPASATAAPSRPAPASPSAASGSDQYDVHVSGLSVEELNKRLSGRGLAAETSANGVVVKPSLPLRDAVALSKDLAVEGFKVQVRRAGAAAAAAPAPAAPASDPTLHRVRVGAFSDRAAAQAAVRELQAKGYKPFIARGTQ